jgi:ribosomal protein L37AE/L43A
MTGTNYPAYGVNGYTTFAGLCNECHSQLALTGSASAPAAAATWLTKERVHQSVAGWAATGSGTDNLSNRRHAYTCAKCHAPHVSRLPRLLVTNCLDVRHFGQVATGGTIPITPVNSTTAGNIETPTNVSSAQGAGRFPGGGSRYSGTPASSQNSGGWWFQTNNTNSGTMTQPAAKSYGNGVGTAPCHNTNSGTYDPTKQIWNKKSRW